MTIHDAQGELISPPPMPDIENMDDGQLSTELLNLAERLFEDYHPNSLLIREAARRLNT